jgi:hypothetical protein
MTHTGPQSERMKGGIAMKPFLFVVAALHAGFTVCELFPWPLPVLLKVASTKLPDLSDGNKWTSPQRQLVATIVHNAGIYNAILTGGFVWAALTIPVAHEMAQFLLAGAVVAGVFGTVTLKTFVPAIQAIFGGIGLILLRL